MQKVSAKVPFSSNMLLQLCKTKGAVSPAALDALELLAQTCTHSCLQCKQQHVVSLGKMNPARVRPAQPKQCLRTCVEHFPGSLECKQRTETGSLMRLVMFNGGPALTEFLCVSSLEFKCFSWHMQEKKNPNGASIRFSFSKTFSPALKTANMSQPQFVLMLCVSVRIFLLRSEQEENVSPAVLPAWFGSCVCEPVRAADPQSLSRLCCVCFTPQHTHNFTLTCCLFLVTHTPSPVQLSTCAHTARQMSICHRVCKLSQLKRWEG